MHEKAASSYERKELEAEFKKRGTEIHMLKAKMRAILFKTQQNRLDTALAAGYRSTLHSLCRKAINKQQFKGIAKAWLEGE